MKTSEKKSNMKVVYVGIDLLYPALPALLENGCEILKIYTCETDNETEFNLQVCAFAREHNIPLKIGKINNEEIDWIISAGIEILICAGYYYKIPVNSQIKMINIHPSLLPVGRGAWPMPITILKGLKESGVTIHKLEEKLDSWDILLQKRIDVSEDDNLDTLVLKQQLLLPDMIEELVAKFDDLYKNAFPQGEGEYWSCPSETEVLLTKDTDYLVANRQLRAFYGYECRYKKDGVIYGMIRAKALKGNENDQILLESEKFPLKNGSIQSENSYKIPVSITFHMREQIEEIRCRYHHDSSSHAFESLWVWREDMNLSILLEKDFFAVRCKWKGKNAWFFPCGSKEKMRQFIEEHQTSNFSLCYMREQDKEWLESEFPGQFELERTDGDDEYLYDVKEQQKLVGKKFSSFRTAIHHLEREYILEIKAVSKENFHDAVEICAEWTRLSEGEDGMKGDSAGETCLKDWFALNMTGIMVYLDEIPYALMGGYPLSSDTYDLAIAKQRQYITGLWEYSRRAFISSLPEQYIIINLEEDLAIEGLRQTKKRMHPIAMNVMYGAKRK